jgi:hypothetical protein
MYFNVVEFWEDNPDAAHCPFRLIDSESGYVIGGVREFFEEQGWFRVLCRNSEFPNGPVLGYCANGTDSLVTQILTSPFRVVPYHDGIDDEPVVYLDTIRYNGGNPVGSWLPAEQPYRHVKSSPKPLE